MEKRKEAQNQNSNKVTAPNFTGKKVTIMGLGLHGGGVEAAKFFIRQGAQVTVTDLRSYADLAPSLHKLKKYKKITYHLLGHQKADFTTADFIWKNPDVVPESPFLRLAQHAHIPLVTDIGIFLSGTKATVIGVTGTRGKSTTTYLIGKFLRTKFSHVYLGGNIRKSTFTFPRHLPRGSFAVLELSSFQLRDLALTGVRLSPQVAILTNILRDHLNKHKNMQEYIAAKQIILKYQRPGNYFFTNPDDAHARKLATRARSRVRFARLPKKLASMVDKNLGKHYRPSVALAVAVARTYGVSDLQIKKILQNFHGLPSRQETIRIFRGIRFINDTTATTPDATIAALERFHHDTTGRLILIAGGQDKKLEFKPLAQTMTRLAGEIIFLPGTATDKLKLLVPAKKTQCAKSMQAAVRMAYRHAHKGDTVLLSPGATSFGLFLNEFDRGDKFVREVRLLKLTLPLTPSCTHVRG